MSPSKDRANTEKAGQRNIDQEDESDHETLHTEENSALSSESASMPPPVAAASVASAPSKSGDFGGGDDSSAAISQQQKQQQNSKEDVPAPPCLLRGNEAVSPMPPQLWSSQQSLPGAFSVRPAVSSSVSATDNTTVAANSQSSEDQTTNLVQTIVASRSSNLSLTQPQASVSTIPFEATLVTEEADAAVPETGLQQQQQQQHNPEAVTNNNGASSAASSSANNASSGVVGLEEEQRQAQHHHQGSAYYSNTADEMPLVIATKEPELNDEETSACFSSRRCAILGLVVAFSVVVILATVWGVVASKQDDNHNHNTHNHDRQDNLTMLETIKQRGYLKCPRHDSVIVSVKMCQAVAAAIFNDKDKIEFVSYTPATRFVLLENGDSDLHVTISPTMERTIQEASTGEAFHFSNAWLFLSNRFAGDPHAVQCMEDNYNHVGNCSDVQVCSPIGTAYYEKFQEVLPARRLVAVPNLLQLTPFFINGTCNVMAAPETFVATSLLREQGYNGSYKVGDNIVSSEHTAIATREDDPQWSNFVNAILLSLSAAEEYNITQDTAQLFPETTLFGEDYRRMFQIAIAAVGNFGELYQDSMEALVPRSILNRVGNGRLSSSSGLHFSENFGDLSEMRNTPLGDTFQLVLERGYLLCGVRLERPGFAQRQFTQPNSNSTTTLDEDNLRNESNIVGMDSDFCRGIASGLFQGDADALEFVVIPSSDPSQGFTSLSKGHVDVLAGAIWNLENSIRQPQTHDSFHFSKPYFFGSEEGDMGLATRQDDHDWSTLVYWVVSALVYAEEQNITSLSYNEMPQLFLFGESFHRLFRDVVYAVGNYGEIYERNIANEPRSGNNLLNENGPRFYLPRGFFD